MGNCLAQQKDKVISVVKPDGKVLEYTASIRVHQILSQNPGHAISDSYPVGQLLSPDDAMISGHHYYLLPLKMLPPALKKKQLSYSYLQREAGGVVRIKALISKKELQEMVGKGVISIDVSQLQDKQGINANGFNKFDGDKGGNRDCNGWKPLLKSIPERD